MADLSDVLNQLASMVATAVYPNGYSLPSVASVDVTIFPGWPIRNKLDDQMNAGNALVSIFPTNKEKDITKFFRDWKQSTVTAPTLTATVVNKTVVIGGMVSVPQSVMVIVDGIGYAYQVLALDTLDSIAAAIALLIPDSTSSGAIVSIPSAGNIGADIGTQGTAGQSLGMQDREFMVTCWCPSPVIRSLLAPPIHKYLSINWQVPLNDNFYCRIFYSHTNEMDGVELSNVYRRDLFFRVQYETTNTATFATVTQAYANAYIEQSL